MAKRQYCVTLREILAAKPCADGRRMAKRLCKLHGFGMDTPIPLSRVYEEVDFPSFAFVVAAMKDQAPARRMVAALVDEVVAALKPDYPTSLYRALIPELKAGRAGVAAEEVISDVRHLANEVEPFDGICYDAVMYCCVSHDQIYRADHLGMVYGNEHVTVEMARAAIEKYLS